MSGNETNTGSRKHAVATAHSTSASQLQQRARLESYFANSMNAKQSSGQLPTDCRGQNAWDPYSARRYERAWRGR